jgi:hypothetical protein
MEIDVAYFPIRLYGWRGVWSDTGKFCFVFTKKKCIRFLWMVYYKLQIYLFVIESHKSTEIDSAALKAASLRGYCIGL